MAAAAQAARCAARGLAEPAGRLPPSELAKRTLTNLYNAPPTWLPGARAPRRAVHAAYGWPYPLSDDEVLACLLEMNLAGATQPVATTAAHL